MFENIIIGRRKCRIEVRLDGGGGKNRENRRLAKIADNFFSVYEVALGDTRNAYSVNETTEVRASAQMALKR